MTTERDEKMDHEKGNKVMSCALEKEYVEDNRNHFSFPAIRFEDQKAIGEEAVLVPVENLPTTSSTLHRFNKTLQRIRQ